jgi:hypothetical protein
MFQNGGLLAKRGADTQLLAGMSGAPVLVKSIHFFAGDGVFGWAQK